MTENEVATQIVDVGFKIHTAYGPGLLESVYETIMAYELGSAVSPRSGNNQYPSYTKRSEWNSASALI